MTPLIWHRKRDDRSVTGLIMSCDSTIVELPLTNTLDDTIRAPRDQTDFKRMPRRDALA